MRTLIIGGTGLISTAITKTLLEQGHSVTHFNRGQRSSPFAEQVQTIVGDRNDYPAFEMQMREAGEWDCVIDMIGYLPEDAQSDVRAFKGRIGHFIFCSTVDVYAKPATRYPYLEDEPHAPLNDYGLNKSKCEQILMEADARGDFPVTIIRPAQTYGDSGALIHPFGWGTAYIDRLRRGKPIIVHGDGTSLWTTGHVDDVGPTFAAAAGNAHTFGKAYHVTGEEWLTWNQMYCIAADVLGAPAPQLVHIPTSYLLHLAPGTAAIIAQNFMHNNIFDNSAAKRDLNFQYTVTFREGAKRVIQWLDEHNGIQNSDEQHDYNHILRSWDRIDSEAGRRVRVCTPEVA